MSNPPPASTWLAMRLGDFPGEALDAFSPQEYRNYFRHRGYHATYT